MDNDEIAGKVGAMWVEQTVLRDGCDLAVMAAWRWRTLAVPGFDTHAVRVPMQRQHYPAPCDYAEAICQLQAWRQGRMLDALNPRREPTPAAKRTVLVKHQSGVDLSLLSGFNVIEVFNTGGADVVLLA